MLFAILNGERVEAKPKTKAICQLCGQLVLSKCGEVNIWHWAHQKNESCDNWFEHETEWHKNWKLIFGKDNCEKPICKDNSKHIADIYTKEEVVIELQNSSIEKAVIRKREDFYGEKMIWVINGKHFKENFLITRFLILEDMEYYHRHNPLSKYYGKNNDSWKFEFDFSWSWCRKTWRDVQRHVFIDFGDENLYWIKEGMGMARGKCMEVSKAKFVQKYGGDLALLQTIIDNPGERTL